MKRNAKGQFVKTTNLINHICICLDRSMSMASISNDAKNAYNEWVRRIKDEAAKNKQATTVSVIEFGSGAEVILNGETCSQLQARYIYRTPDGSTALFYGLQTGINTLEQQPVKFTQNESYLLICITDGQENSSYQYGVSALGVSTLMKSLQKTDKWTFAFLLPPGDKGHFCMNYGIPEGNVQEWEATTAGVQKATKSTSQGISSYYTSRAAGQSSVQNFYVDADLSNINTTKIKKVLDNVESECIVLSVPREIDIKSFVKQKTGNYTIGTAYYQLTKPETVQANKDILIMEKGKTAVYSGNKARQLLGLPIGVNAKLNPYNLSKYDVFVLSNSVNRKLVRGTKLIVYSP